MSSHVIGRRQVCKDVIGVTIRVSVGRKRLAEQVGLTCDLGQGRKGDWKGALVFEGSVLMEAI